VVASVDLAFLDACFYSASELPGRDMSKVPHPLVVDTLERLAGLPHGRVVLVHLNHTNPVWRSGSEQRAVVEAAGVSVGEQGASHAL
jgi:pyrroloquinoline quinone biosynthesis protein B